MLSSSDCGVEIVLGVDIKMGIKWIMDELFPNGNVVESLKANTFRAWLFVT